jgi:uncharacterized protein YegP (UPF0339 family)
MLYFDLQKSTNGQWYFNVRSAGNHRIVATSETYHNRQDALHTVQLIRQHAASAAVWDSTTQRWAA